MRLQQLKYSEGGRSLVSWLPSPPADHTNWKKGTNSAGGGMKTLRILMPLALAIDILERDDMSVFVAGGGVGCQLDQLRNPDHPVFF